MGIKIENEGCGDYEVEIDGADDVADRGPFAREAQKAGFQVTFEQTGTTSGFRCIDIVRVGGAWAVVMPQVPVAHALSIAAEVHRAGFRIAFTTG